MNDSWAVRFKEQRWGAGILILENGQVRGADSRFRYSGTFTKTGNVLVAHKVLIQRKGSEGAHKVRIERKVSDGAHVFADALYGYDDICLDLTGTIQGDKGTAIGAIGTTVHQLNGTLTKQGS